MKLNLRTLLLGMAVCAIGTQLYSATTTILRRSYEIRAGNPEGQQYREQGLIYVDTSTGALYVKSTDQSSTTGWIRVLKANGDTATHLQGVVSGTGGTVTNLQGTVSNLSGTLLNMRGSVSNLSGTLQNMQGSVSNLSGTAQNLQGSVSNLSGTLQNMEGSVSNLTGTLSGIGGSSSNLYQQGTERYGVEALQTMTATNTLAITGGPIFPVVGSGGAIILTNYPQVNDGVFGQVITIYGTGNTVEFVDDDQDSGSGIQLGDTNRVLGSGDILRLIYLSIDTNWWEIGFSNN